MHLSALPSAYGIGTLGYEAYRFVDFLKYSGQKYWQLLPLVPLGEGNSPYKSSSCYAGEILYIDLDLLVLADLLKPEEIPEDPFKDGERINFEKLKSELEIQKHMEVLGITREQAEQLWLEDNTDFEDEEMKGMREKAKQNRRYENKNI